MKTIFVNKTPGEIYFCEEHSHACWELVLQLNGRAVTKTAQGDFELTPGDIIIIPPHTVHLEKSDNPFLDMYIQAEDLPFGDKPFTVSDHNGAIGEMFNTLHKCYFDKVSSKVCDGLLETICEYIAVLNNESYKYPFVKDLKNKLTQNVANPDFDLNHAVLKMGINYDYMRRCFKEDVGVTPLEFLTEIRISHGKKLLLQTPFYSVSEVAYQCGFTDPFYFSRCFKKHVGVSPREYKNR